MQIRPANTGDIPGLLRLLHQVGQIHHQIRPDLFRSGAVKYTACELGEILADPERPVFVAVEESVLGYCFCQVKRYSGSTVLEDRKELYIDDLCVEESCRGQQVGRRLYEHTCEFARGIGCGYVSLNVWCGNDSAMEFYFHRNMTPRSITMESKL